MTWAAPPVPTALTPVPLADYDRPTVDVARGLVGAYLLRATPTGLAGGRIVETEAYVGSEDRASHASRGLTERTRLMFGEPGHAYIYLIYGMYHCLNVVTEAAGFPAAVLIRAIDPHWGIGTEPIDRTDGPGRLCRALGIDRTLNDHPLDRAPLWLARADDENRYEPARVVASPRVGVDYAGEWAERPWRFSLVGSRWVSRPRPSAPPESRGAQLA